MSERVFVGLSGGVDSALATALLIEQGYDVTAVYMRNWSRDLPGFRCPWAEELADAERIAVTLGCDLQVWDFEEEYKRTVVDYLVDSYRRGYTPNPDVMCNQTVKFGSFAERAFAEGADLIATGHYARTRRAADGATELHRAADEHKDQTYFLWRVPEAAFARTLLPIGDYATKADVRAACAERSLGVENKPDSDGICFIGPVGIRTFLLDELDRRSGDIVEYETGRVLGHHDGAFLYTVGQRRGLDLGGGPARYVVKTDVDANAVYVTADHESPALYTREIELEDVHWISGVAPAAGEYLVRTRHTGELRPARIEFAAPTSSLQRGHSADGASLMAAESLSESTAESACAKLVFTEPVRRVAPGQSAVLYDGTRCLGGGIIAV
ncbi:MAG: tRNA 2-thiouridine(34) synthase MnmA [Olegusella sp.]|nr:tRNA 2-thiouridine(34) synthase MnmA [Olegusella sp.]